MLANLSLVQGDYCRRWSLKYIFKRAPSRGMERIPLLSYDSHWSSKKALQRTDMLVCGGAHLAGENILSRQRRTKESGCIWKSASDLV